MKNNSEFMAFGFGWGIVIGMIIGMLVTMNFLAYGKIIVSSPEIKCERIKP